MGNKYIEPQKKILGIWMNLISDVKSHLAKPSSTVADKLNMLETLLREMSEESRKIVITSKVLSHLIYELPLYLNCRDTDKAIHTGQ